MTESKKRTRTVHRLEKQTTAYRNAMTEIIQRVINKETFSLASVCRQHSVATGLSVVMVDMGLIVFEKRIGKIKTYTTKFTVDDITRKRAKIASGLVIERNKTLARIREKKNGAVENEIHAQKELPLFEKQSCLRRCTIDDLLYELRRRGCKGNFTITTTQNITL